MKKRSKSIVTPADEGARAAKLEAYIRDEGDHRCIFRTTHTSTLWKMLRGEIDLLALARKEMDKRGLDEEGDGQKGP